MGRRRQREQEQLITQTTDTQTDEMKVWQEQQRANLERQKQQYKQFEFRNPFAGMENPFEDLTVDQQSAQFQMEQGRQQRANILASLSGAAGASGIAGLAQTLAGQGTLQARQITADIARQEKQNEMMYRQGEQMVASAEAGRVSTMYGAELGNLAGARAGFQSAQANEMAGLGAISQMTSARMGMYGDIIGGVAGGISGGVDWTKVFTP